MAIVDSEIVAYAAANKPTDDSSLNGGAIDADASSSTRRRVWSGTRTAW